MLILNSAKLTNTVKGIHGKPLIIIDLKHRLTLIKTAGYIETFNYAIMQEYEVLVFIYITSDVGYPQ